ncbi:hypothetical protein I2486_10235 [Cellulophaga sp. E16_2]|uniref:Transmembrane protein n=1 Tax=Cellulophaga algicola (strain DSM 14237 / IC166 / ACAM 630) TaxID=688270 RepID=E6X4K8_CELAD|nr:MULTISPECIES: hypothetical protein [Cellulophaga]ADV49333.1 putative transmembrane protein [Cellulophaga algicola DSM 14237]MBO0591784.1 hypothetical protein [Cellulophaga sp. E16_2]
MKAFLKFIAYALHPVFIPLYGSLIYFQVTRKYTSLEMQIGNLLPIFILSVIIPIISFLILRNIGIVNSLAMSTIKERKYPIYISIILLFMIIYKVIPNNYTIELYYYFIGLVIALFTVLVLLFARFSNSIHMVGIGSLIMYMINLSVHFEINLTLSISVLILLGGLLASSRLYFRTHSKLEIVGGLLLGVTTQFMTLNYWL